MSLSIDFSNLPNHAPFTKELQKLPKKLWKLSVSEEKVRECLKFLSQEESERILSLLYKERRYIEKLGLAYDSHLEVEKLGIGMYSKKYTTVISLKENIDLIFYMLMGTPLDATRSIPDYSEFSRNLITLNLEDLKISLEGLMDLHPTIELGVLKMASEFGKSFNIQDDSFRTKFINYFHSNIQSKIRSLIDHIVVSILQDAGTGKISLRSRSFGEFVISKDSPEDVEVEIKIDGIVYPITFKSYPVFGYIFEVGR